MCTSRLLIKRKEKKEKRKGKKEKRKMKNSWSGSASVLADPLQFYRRFSAGCQNRFLKSTTASFFIFTPSRSRARCMYFGSENCNRPLRYPTRLTTRCAGTGPSMTLDCRNAHPTILAEPRDRKSAIAP